jgi:hypothetical protein
MSSINAGIFARVASRIATMRRVSILLAEIVSDRIDAVCRRATPASCAQSRSPAATGK